MSPTPHTPRPDRPITVVELDRLVTNACALRPVTPPTHRGVLFFRHIEESGNECWAKVLLSKQNDYWVADTGAVYYDDPDQRPFFRLPLAVSGVAKVDLLHGRSPEASKLGELDFYRIVPYTGEEPRQYTAQEMTDKFVEHAFALADYWADPERAVQLGNEPGIFQRMTGLLHSLFAGLDGNAVNLPGFILVPHVREEDIQFNQHVGDNWWPKSPELKEEDVLAWPLIDTWRRVEKEYEERSAQNPPQVKAIEHAAIAPRHVASLKEALQVATFITNPDGVTFRVNSYDPDMDLLAYTNEATGQEHCCESVDVRDWTIHTLQAVTYDA